jgi:hypothetical protein
MNYCDLCGVANYGLVQLVCSGFDCDICSECLSRLRKIAKGREWKSNDEIQASPKQN